MKKMIYPHISDIIGKIKYFVYATDGIDAIFSLSTIYDDDTQSEIDALLSLPDNRFANIPKDRLHKIADIQVIDRQFIYAKRNCPMNSLPLLQRNIRKSMQLVYPMFK